MTGATLNEPHWCRRRSEDLGAHQQQQRRLWTAAAVTRKSLSSVDSVGGTKQQQQFHPQLRLSMPSPASTTSSSPGFRPWSSGGSTASSVDDNSGTPLSSSSVRFVGVSRKDAHCVYMVHVDSGTEQFVLQKRYSQFREFRQQLFALLEASHHCGSGPCKQLLQQLSQVKFPRRKLLGAWKSGGDLAVARERLVQLQRFTDALLRIYRAAPKRQIRCCVNTKCPAMEAVRQFLQLSGPEDTAVVSAPKSGAHETEVVLDSAGTSSSNNTNDDLESPACVSEPSRRSATRGFPPPTRMSLRAETAHQFDQLYPITEDSELVHMHA